MDVPALRPEAPISAYPRSAIDVFVANAAAEQCRLEQAFAEARNRERRARAATAESQSTARVLRSTMQELRGELDERRRQVEAQVDGILSRAFDEAASILADARLRARLETAVDPHPVATRAEPPLAAAPATPGSASAVFPRIGAPIDLTGALRSRNRLGAIDFAGLTHAGGNGSEPEPNGELTHSSNDGAAADREAPELDLTADAASDRRKGSAFGAILRWSRNRDAVTEEAPEPDEFLDFLRGALLDDRPLDAPEDEAGPDVRWRPTA